jgi:hypothetical protein
MARSGLAPGLRSAPNAFIASSGFGRLKSRNSDLEFFYRLDQRLNGAISIVTEFGKIFRVPRQPSIPFCIG